MKRQILISIIFVLSLFNNNLFSQFGTQVNMEKIAVFPDCKDLEGAEQIDCTNQKLFEFIIANMTYPKDAVEQRIQGTVILQYEIDKEGKIQNLEVIESVHQLLDDEAMRIMALLPKLEPATLHGRPVSMKFNVPMMFQLYEEGEE